MKKFIITQENLAAIEKVIQPLLHLNQPIPSSTGMNLINILSSLEEVKEPQVKES